MAINEVSISGNLVADCELKGKESDICTFTVAVNDRRKVGEEWKDVPSYIDCVLFGKRAAPVGAYLKKGVKVAVSGRLRQDRWEKDGNKHSKVSVTVNEVEFLSRIQPEKADDDIPW